MHSMFVNNSSFKTFSYFSEHPVFMGLFNVPPGKKFSIRQLQGTYGPFLIKSSHFDIYQENC